VASEEVKTLQSKLTLVVAGDELLLEEGVLAHVSAGLRRQFVNRPRSAVMGGIAFNPARRRSPSC
jgi:hypothetical protein